jgi:hypothetical protein
MQSSGASVAKTGFKLYLFRLLVLNFNATMFFEVFLTLILATKDLPERAAAVSVLGLQSCVPVKLNAAGDILTSISGVFSTIFARVPSFNSQGPMECRGVADFGLWDAAMAGVEEIYFTSWWYNLCITVTSPRAAPSVALWVRGIWLVALHSSTPIGPNQPFQHQMSKQLKSARTAIDKQDWNEAKRLCHLILQEEVNYNAFVFLGVAEEKLLNVEAAIEAYNNAIALNSDLPLAHQVCVGHSVD